VKPTDQAQNISGAFPLKCSFVFLVHQALSEALHQILMFAGSFHLSRGLEQVFSKPLWHVLHQCKEQNRASRRLTDCVDPAIPMIIIRRVVDDKHTKDSDTTLKLRFPSYPMYQIDNRKQLSK